MLEQGCSAAQQFRVTTPGLHFTPQAGYAVIFLSRHGSAQPFVSGEPAGRTPRRRDALQAAWQAVQVGCAGRTKVACWSSLCTWLHLLEVPSAVV